MSSTVRTTTTTTSVFTCPADPDLPVPSSPEEHRGKSWPTECIDKEEGHFFGIGDWGGLQAGQVWWNTGAPRGKAGPQGPADTQAATFVGRQMKTLADKVKPDYVLNAGDNFYPGGYRTDCMVNWNNDDETKQFEEVFGSNESFSGVTPIYGKGVGDIPWLSVLGNHDYGGFRYNMGWDAQVYHTWSGADNWRMPAQYWHQHVKYRGFSVDFYMLDSNYPDATAGGGGSEMCDNKGGHWDCWSMDGGNCPHYFRSLFDDGVAWLETKLQNSSDSDGPNWRVLLTHFPVDAWGQPGQNPKIAELHEKYGFHLIFTGHRHQQDFWFDGPAKIPVNWVVSGGGGGITSEHAPSWDGRDLQYGFVDFKINAEDLTVEFYSWGGEDGSFLEPLISKKILQSEPRKEAADTGRATSLALV